MLTENKRQPAFTDTDAIQFGKHRGELLQDVPAHYLRWLWTDGGFRQYSRSYTEIAEITFPNRSIHDKVKLANYIWNSREAIEQELGDTFI